MDFFGFGSKQQGKQPAQPEKKPQTPLGMLKSKVDAKSTSGLLRDNWSKIDQQIKDAGG